MPLLTEKGKPLLNGFEVFLEYLYIANHSQSGGKSVGVSSFLPPWSNSLILDDLISLWLCNSLIYLVNTYSGVSTINEMKCYSRKLSQGFFLSVMLTNSVILVANHMTVNNCELDGRLLPNSLTCYKKWEIRAEKTSYLSGRSPLGRLTAMT